MMRKILAATALALATTAAPANAAFLLSFGGIPSNVGGGLNSFASNLSGALGLPDVSNLAYVDNGASLTISEPGYVTFYLLAAESGYTNSFYVNNVLMGSEHDEYWDDSDNPGRWLGTVAYSGSSPISITDWAFKTSGAGIGGVNADIGFDGFGFFMDLGQLTGMATNTLYIGYDDQNHDYYADDDNHDDFVIKAVFTPVPEAATWAMLLSGFATVGAAMRRRRSVFRAKQAV